MQKLERKIRFLWGIFELLWGIENLQIFDKYRFYGEFSGFYGELKKQIIQLIINALISSNS
jgi:hypothetical protein